MPTCTDACTAGCVPYLSGASCSNRSSPAVFYGCHKCNETSACTIGPPNDRRRFRAKNAIALQSVEQMMEELYENGPITVGFNVFSNFKSFFQADPLGVYNTTHNASHLGAHGVKIIGWGETAGMPYWLIANSWSPTWGNAGQCRQSRCLLHLQSV